MDLGTTFNWMISIYYLLPKTTINNIQNKNSYSSPI